MVQDGFSVNTERNRNLSQVSPLLAPITLPRPQVVVSLAACPWLLSQGICLVDNSYPVVASNVRLFFFNTIAS